MTTRPRLTKADRAAAALLFLKALLQKHRTLHPSDTESAKLLEHQIARVEQGEQPPARRRPATQEEIPAVAHMVFETKKKARGGA